MPSPIFQTLCAVVSAHPALGRLLPFPIWGTPVSPFVPVGGVQRYSPEQREEIGRVSIPTDKNAIGFDDGKSLVLLHDPYKVDSPTARAYILGVPQRAGELRLSCGDFARARYLGAPGQIGLSLRADAAPSRSWLATEHAVASLRVADEVVWAPVASAIEQLYRLNTELEAEVRRAAARETPAPGDARVMPWVNKQRRDYQASRLTRAQRRDLEGIPGWSW